MEAGDPGSNLSVPKAVEARYVERESESAGPACSASSGGTLRIHANAGAIARCSDLPSNLHLLDLRGPPFRDPDQEPSTHRLNLFVLGLQLRLVFAGLSEDEQHVERFRLSGR